MTMAPDGERPTITWPLRVVDASKTYEYCPYIIEDAKGIPLARCWREDIATMMLAALCTHILDHMTPPTTPKGTE